MTETASRDAVLLPTGREMKTYGCMRSLGSHDIHTIVASDCGPTPHFSSRFCGERGELPPHEHQLTDYKDALLEYASRPDVKTIVPVRECDTYVFAKYADEFADHVSLVTPPLDTLRAAHDRLALAEAAEEAGVPYADTRLLSEVDAAPTEAVVKSRYNLLTAEYVDSCSPDDALEVNDVTFLETGDEPDADAIRETMGHDPIVQEFVPRADKHLYCALWVNGEPLVTYQHRQIRSVSWVGGGGVYRRSAYSQEVEDAAYDLLSHLDWNGFACIEYIKDADTGEWKFLEINPRVWHSMPEAVRAGVDFPYYYWLTARGDADEVDATYDVGVPCHTSYGELKYLLSILGDESPFDDPPSFLRSALAVGASCVRSPRFDYLRLDDPRFTFSALRSLASLDRGKKYEN